MTRVLAAIDGSPVDEAVLATAGAVADLLGARVDPVHTRAARAIVEAAQAVDVVQVVTGATVASIEVASALPKPLVIVPSAATPRESISRILVPVDGTRETAEALGPTFELASRAELTVIALHVLDYVDLPLFSDQPHHEAEAWAREFLRRHCPHPERVRLETRVGEPSEHVLDLAGAAAIDLVALAWAQRLDDDRAAVVRDVLAGSRVPVLLVPLEVTAANAARGVVTPAS